MTETEKKILVVIDMQNDFVEPAGSLSVAGAMNIVPIINDIRVLFDKVLFTYDWHPQNHVSFVNNHPGHKLFELVQAGEVQQMLFPAHCVQDTQGAELQKDISIKSADLIVRKGLKSDVDSYSCFFDVVKSSQTPAHQILQSIGAKTLYFLGVATDFCVKFSVLDALSLGYKCYVIEDGIAAVNPEEGVKAINEMKEKGAIFIKSSQI